jgi:DNA polymerase III psi subunit
MTHPEIIAQTFREELYNPPPKVVVAMATGWVTLAENEKLLLEKILSAVKLSLSHVNIIQTDTLDVLHWPNRPSHVLAFGLALTGFSRYEPFDVHGIHVILAPSLTQLEPDKDGKQKLWGALRKVFV